MTRLAAILGVLLCLGCASKPAPNPVVKLSEIAPEVMKVAQDALPDVTFESCGTIDVNGQVVFEIRGTMPNGKVRELKVSASGKVVDSR